MQTTLHGDVCFVRGVPNSTGLHVHNLRWEPRRWHFPDLKDSDLDWVLAILSPVLFSYIDCDLVLPRDGLSRTGARRLLELAEEWPNMAIYCEPHSKFMTCNNTAIECFELSTISIIHWILPGN
ncbi:uncharacterized protein LOC108682721 [Hyalella azteca]|uniref:Uncharacterized protein LOC108682721 n=1 Tax=Hyalella azteca TaxID=294128 RepID=A0A979FKV9_HYAAZ|nr:uncharacterized protein LOC108682721 [Hyalella azteca]